MKSYEMIFSDYSGHIASTRQTINAANLQQASLRALRELWSIHRKRPELIRASIFKDQKEGFTHLFTATILERD